MKREPERVSLAMRLLNQEERRASCGASSATSGALSSSSALQDSVNTSAVLAWSIRGNHMSANEGSEMIWMISFESNVAVCC